MPPSSPPPTKGRAPSTTDADRARRDAVDDARPLDIVLEEGTLLAQKYRLARPAGFGGMAQLWVAKNEATGAEVCVKILVPDKSDDESVERFRREAHAAARLSHRAIVRIFDLVELGVDGEATNRKPAALAIVMELLHGETLGDYLMKRGKLPVDEAIDIGLPVLSALAHAHRAGVVHRDLKPDNIFLATNVEPDETDGLPYVVKLVDFGIAKMLDVERVGAKGLKGPTQDGSVIGTPNFMSPEQLTIGGTPSPLTDIWSLGACTYAAFTARIPFEGEVLGDIVLKVCVEPLPSPRKWNPDAPEGLDAWFHRACHREPAKRFQTVEEMSESLAKVCGLGAVKVATKSEDRVQYAMKAADPSAIDDLPDEMPSPGMNAKTALLAGIIVGVCLMVGLVGFLAWRERQAADDAEKQAPALVAPAPNAPNAPKSAPR